MINVIFVLGFHKLFLDFLIKIENKASKNIKNGACFVFYGIFISRHFNPSRKALWQNINVILILGFHNFFLNFVIKSDTTRTRESRIHQRFIDSWFCFFCVKSTIAGLEAVFQVPIPGDSGSSPNTISISNYCLTQEIFTPTPADCCPSISLKKCFGQ